MKLDNPTAVVFETDQEARTIKGLALPFGEPATSGGRAWQFAKGSVSWSKVKLLNGHDWSQVVGIAELEETDEGILMTAKVARGPRGDEILELAEMGAIDGLSIGLADDVHSVVEDGIHYVKSGTIREVSTTPIPAFKNAAIRSVAASEDTTKENTMDKENETGVAAQFEEKVTTLETKVEELGAKFAKIDDIAIPTASAKIEVKEEPIYRFAGSERAPSGFDFAEDVWAAANGDAAALERVTTFTEGQLTGPSFVATTNVDEVNPSVYRPDMFLGQAPVPTSPLYDTFHKGGLSNVTPFFYSKLDRSATTVAVADHVEGTDPTLTNLVTATGATVTPSAVSGRVHITREVADQGGNPNVSALVWAEFERSFKIALETKTYGLINAAAASITSLTSSIAAGADGKAAGDAIEEGLIGLQFLADGSRFTQLFGHIDLYKALASYENADGEKRYPIINPQNRSGVSGSKYSFIDIAGYRMSPAHSLGATAETPSNSLLADPNAVHVWNSGIKRLDRLQEKVEGWDVGVFGYFAGIVYDVTGLRKIAYDPTA